MSRNKKHKHRFKTDPDSSHTVPSCTLSKRSAVWAAAADASTVAEAAAIAELLPQQKPHDYTIHNTRNATYKISKETAQSEKHWHFNADLEFIANSKLSTKAHLVCICPWNGSRRYVLFFIITSEIIMQWRSASFWDCLNRYKHYLELQCCVPGV